MIFFPLGQSLQPLYKVISLIFFFSMLIIVSQASGLELESFKGKKGKLNIEGGTTHIPIMMELAREIMNFNELIKIHVRGGGSSFGIKQVGEGFADIGNSGRALKEKELQQYELASIPFAIDGIAVVVHPSNPVSGLSKKQVRQIFSGQITNWQQINGKDSKIKLYGRDKNSATRSTFWRQLLNEVKFYGAIQTIDSNNTMKIIVSMDTKAIGYMSMGLVDHEKIKAVAIDGVFPDQKNILDNKYAVSRKLYANLPKQPSELAQLFISYLLGPEGKKVTMKYGFIPIN